MFMYNHCKVKLMSVKFPQGELVVQIKIAQ